MPRLGARDIRQIVAVAEQGSIRRAAELLGMTQPGLSKNIRLIEERLGVQMFDRSTAGARLTRAGDQLVARGRSILGDIDALEHDLVRSSRVEEGAVRVGLGPFMAVILGESILTEVRRNHPGVALSVELMDPADFISRIEAGQIDIAYGKLEDVVLPRSLEARVVYRHRLAYFVRPGHPLALKPEVRLADLKGYGFAGATVYDRFLRWFEERTGCQREDFHFICPDFELLGEVVAKTDLVAGTAPVILTRLQAHHDLVEIPIPDGEFIHDVYCIRQRDALPLPVERVMQAIEACIESHAEHADSTFCAPPLHRH